MMKLEFGDCSLQDFIDLPNKGSVFSEDEIFYYFKPIVETLSILQKNNLAHRDIKPQNLIYF